MIAHHFLPRVLGKAWRNRVGYRGTKPRVGALEVLLRSDDPLNFMSCGAVFQASLRGKLGTGGEVEGLGINGLTVQ